MVKITMDILGILDLNAQAWLPGWLVFTIAVVIPGLRACGDTRARHPAPGP
jgi:hypothetical protein